MLGVFACQVRHRFAIAGAITDAVFLSLHSSLGAGSFLLFAAVAAMGGLYTFFKLPETRGRSLAEVQAMMKPVSAEEGAADLQPHEAAARDVPASPPQTGFLLQRGLHLAFALLLTYKAHLMETLGAQTVLRWRKGCSMLRSWSDKLNGDRFGSAFASICWGIGNLDLASARGNDC